MKKILLLGGMGFIGHNLFFHLNNLGYNIKIADSLKINNLESPNQKSKIQLKILDERVKLLRKYKIENLKVDANDKENLNRLLIDFKPDVVVHLGAVSHAKESNLNPHVTFKNNLNSIETTLELIKNSKIHYIYFSSSMVYGDFIKPTVDEESICNPIGIYGTYKYSAELMIKAYSKIFDLNYTIIRPSALYGERCISRRVSQIFIENAIAKKPIIIDGDGQEKLDFTYIEDLCSGVEQIISNKKSINQIFNLTFGSARKIIELVEILKNYFNDVEVQFKKRDKLMPFRGTLSNAKAKNLINFNPKFSIENGYVKYIEWYKEFYNR
tara:strand:+ start:7163 stop:8140 length:978 start_codon:yes stop_codon:yes gene_type:complete